MSSLERVRKCRRTARGKTVELNRLDGVASYGNLTTCGSVWACPACATSINAARSEELTLALENWHLRGGTVALLTLTMRHKSGVPLARYWDALSPAITAALGGGYSRARAAKKAAGFHGYALTRETTYGENGWHLHAHALLFLQGPTPAALTELGDAVFAAWSSSLKRSGLAAPSYEHGTDLKVLSLEKARAEAAGYLAKGSYEAHRAARELTRDGGKQARRGNRTHWDILSDIASATAMTKKVKRDISIWREWEQASHGRQALTWSNGLRESVGLGRDQHDIDIADSAADPVPGSETVLCLTNHHWGLVCARTHGPTDLLELAESISDLDDATRACSALVLSWDPDFAPT
jgi:hypothetical protein